MNPLEKCARAIAEVPATTVDDVRDVLSERAIERVARACLDAIRDMPPSTVESVAAHVFGPNPLPHEVSNFDGGWTAMIDHILSQ